MKRKVRIYPPDINSQQEYNLPKQSYGGIAPQNHNTDEFGAKRLNTFKGFIANQTQSALMKKAQEEFMSRFQMGGGSSMNAFGFNPNLNNVQAFAKANDALASQQALNSNNFVTGLGKASTMRKYDTETLYNGAYFPRAPKDTMLESFNNKDVNKMINDNVDPILQNTIHPILENDNLMVSAYGGDVPVMQNGGSIKKGDKFYVNNKANEVADFFTGWDRNRYVKFKEPLLIDDGSGKQVPIYEMSEENFEAFKKKPMQVKVGNYLSGKEIVPLSQSSGYGFGSPKLKTENKPYYGITYSEQPTKQVYDEYGRIPHDKERYPQYQKGYKFNIGTAEYELDEPYLYSDNSSDALVRLKKTYDPDTGGRFINPASKILTESEYAQLLKDNNVILPNPKKPVVKQAAPATQTVPVVVTPQASSAPKTGAKPTTSSTGQSIKKPTPVQDYVPVTNMDEYETEDSQTRGRGNIDAPTTQQRSYPRSNQQSYPQVQPRSGNGRTIVHEERQKALLPWNTTKSITYEFGLGGEEMDMPYYADAGETTYNQPQLWKAEIQNRRALLPGNRFKSITMSFGPDGRPISNGASNTTSKTNAIQDNNFVTPPIISSPELVLPNKSASSHWLENYSKEAVQPYAHYKPESEDMMRKRRRDDILETPNAVNPRLGLAQKNIPSLQRVNNPYTPMETIEEVSSDYPLQSDFVTPQLNPYWNPREIYPPLNRGNSFQKGGQNLWDAPWAKNDKGEEEFMRTRTTASADRWGQAAHMIGPGMDMITGMKNRLDNRSNEQQFENLTNADNVFQPMQGNQGYNPFNQMGNDFVTGATPVQFTGRAQYGGAPFQEGGEYEVDDDTIQYILAMGGEIEYLD